MFAPEGGRIQGGGLTPSHETRFVIDVMLGRLARWLRLLGYDSLYDPRWDDLELARISARQDRLLLTRDRQLAGRRLVRNSLLIESDHVADQLRFVVHRLGLSVKQDRLFTRCTVCNEAIRRVGREQVDGRIPPFVVRKHTRFAECDGCGRIYWGGSHEEMALAQLRKMLPRADWRERRDSNPRPQA